MKKTILACVLCIVLCMFGGCAADVATVDNVLVSTEGMTAAQKAVVITAESYFLRGTRAQYDQTNFNTATSRKVRRRTTGLLKPEDYTAQSFSYHDCSSFVFDVYWNALGMDFSEGTNKRNTKSYMDNQYCVLRENPQEDFGELSKEEIEKKEQEFRDALQPGDIIVYRKKGNTAGHAMLYAGNDRMFHSSGSDYNSVADVREDNGTYLHESVEEVLLTVGSKRYLMTQHSYVILRPLDSFRGAIPADTVSRIGAMRGIMAEKLSSHNYGQTVNPGEELIFTFHMGNHSTDEKVLHVTDTVPAYTQYISGAEKVDGDKLTWTVTIPAGEARDVSYKVKVTDDTAMGKAVRSESTIESIAVNCREIYIGNTLTVDKQQALAQALKAKKSAGLLGIELLNAAYKEAVGYEALPGAKLETLNEQIFTFWNGTEIDMAIDESLPLASMVPHRLYGGMFVVEKVEKEDDIPQMDAYRTRLLEEHLLVPGDVVVVDTEGYVYTGESLIMLSDGSEYEGIKLEEFGSSGSFAVLRPSLAHAE